MSRIYKVLFGDSAGGVAVSAAQDLIQITGASGKMLRILHRWVGSVDTTIPTAQMIQLRERLLPATVTNGSGGSTPTIYKMDPGDASASFTALANNTTKATTSGTASESFATGVHIYNGFDDEYVSPPVIGPSEAWVFELLSTVSGTVHLSGGVLVEEIGG
jgi:hypothetical protein